MGREEGMVGPSPPAPASMSAVHMSTMSTLLP